MSEKYIEHRQLNSNTGLTLCKSGWWLYDELRGMNLGSEAESPEAALLEALEYYQERLPRVERELRELRSKVKAFVSALSDEDKGEY